MLEYGIDPTAYAEEIEERISDKLAVEEAMDAFRKEYPDDEDPICTDSSYLAHATENNLSMYEGYEPPAYDAPIEEHKAWAEWGHEQDGFEWYEAEDGWDAGWYDDEGNYYGEIIEWDDNEAPEDEQGDGEWPEDVLPWDEYTAQEDCDLDWNGYEWTDYDHVYSSWDPYPSPLDQ